MSISYMYLISAACCKSVLGSILFIGLAIIQNVFVTFFRQKTSVHIQDSCFTWI